MAAGPSRPHPFSFEVLEEDTARVYTARVIFVPTSPRQHYQCSVIVMSGGRLLDVDAHQESVAGEFPPIGRRAQREYLVLGPSGAAFGLTFTTTDGRFDVRVMLGNLLPTGADVPDFDIDETARRISLLYDERDVLRIGRHAGRVRYAVERCSARSTERLTALQATGERRQPEAYRVRRAAGLALEARPAPLYQGLRRQQRPGARGRSRGRLHGNAEALRPQGLERTGPDRVRSARRRQ
jgi:hypothetical protein